MYSVLILAGGLATRLRPLTSSIPKALVLVNGKPFIDYQLNYLHAQGVKKVVLCLGYLGEMIEQHVGGGKRFGLEVSYSYDGENYLGTGGAILKALPLIEDNFFVLYGDSFLPLEFSLVQQCFNRSKALAIMTVLKNKNQWDQSNVRFTGSEKIFYNKEKPDENMDYIDYGLSVLSAKLFENIPENSIFDLAEIFHNLSKNDELYGLEVFERFYEIGSFRGLRETEEYFLIKGMNNELQSTTPTRVN